MAWTLPGAQSVSEWQSPVNGVIATCVEAASAVITGIYGVLPTTPKTTTSLADDLIARGQASARGGATNYVAAGAQLQRLGIPNQSYGADWINNHNWIDTINQALRGGRPVLIGVTNAQALRDSVTGAMPDRGVHNHGLTIVGADTSGYLVADPNTAPGTGFMHYSTANLQAASLSSLTIPTISPSGVTSGAKQIVPDTQVNTTGGFWGGAQDIVTGIGQGVQAAAGDWATRAALIGIAGVLLLVGLLAFFFAGGGRTITVETAKAGAKGAATAAFG